MKPEYQQYNYYIGIIEIQFQSMFHNLLWSTRNVFKILFQHLFHIFLSGNSWFFMASNMQNNEAGNIVFSV